MVGARDGVGEPVRDRAVEQRRGARAVGQFDVADLLSSASTSAPAPSASSSAKPLVSPARTITTSPSSCASASATARRFTSATARTDFAGPTAGRVRIPAGYNLVKIGTFEG
ncbi:MAG TPA: hypothetical protein VGU66_02315 [Candidatus Elarobacter sp.]|nr:hypothetical protein [Candidatus Elarobacter sp.]